MLVMTLYRASHRCARAGSIGWPFAKLLHWTNKVLTSSDIDPRADIDRSVYIPHAIGVVIGETASIGPNTTIMPGVVIGAAEPTSGKRHANIGADVVIGAGAKILGPVRIADGARIGANAVVLDDVAPGATVVGIPAREVA